MKPIEKQLPKYRKVISQLEYTRKLTFIFRMIHHGDMIEEVETNIDGRALELTGPQIYLFSSAKLASYSKDQENTILKKEILPALSEFLKQKGELVKKTIDGIIYDAIVDLISGTEPEKEAVDIITGKNRILYKISNADICDRVRVTGNDVSSRNYDILFKRSTDNGSSFEREINLSNNSGFSEHPQMSSLGNNVYVVWADDTNVNKQIFFRKSNDNGNTFGKEIMLSKNNKNSSDSYNQEI
jgi:hypothetical protein